MLRALTPADVAAVAALDHLTNPSPWSSAQFLAEVHKPTSYFLAVHAAHALIGFGGLWVLPEEGQVVLLAVAPEHRRHGWGKRLLEALIAKAKSEGAKRVTLEVRESAQAALALYEKTGFQVTSRRPKFYEGRETAVLMEKPL